MYRHSPVRNQRSKGTKIRHVLQVCLLVAVCFWLIFQIKRSHDKKKEFDANGNKISLSTHNSDEIVKFGRKDLHPKLEETTKEVEETQEHEDEDGDKIEDEKDDEIDENEEEKSDVEIDREEVDIIDEDKEIVESDDGEKDNEEKDGQSQSQSENEHGASTVDHDEDGSTVHTNEAREEHYKADDASSAVTHDETSSNTTTFQEKDVFTPVNATSSIDSSDNGPPSSTTMNSTESQNATLSTFTEITQESSNSTSISDENISESSKKDVEIENSEENFDPNEIEHEIIDSEHLDEKDVRTDLDTLPEIETEGGNSEDTAAEQCFKTRVIARPGVMTGSRFNRFNRFTEKHRKSCIRMFLHSICRTKNRNKLI